MSASAFDVVIIGAGPSGLAAAARLSHFGVRVCLLEAHTRLGGLSSWHHVAGREISSGLHAFTNFSSDGRSGALGKLLRQLRLKPTDVALCPQGKSSIRFPSATLHFSNDPDFFRDQVATVFPDSIAGFDSLRQVILATDEGELTRRQTSARAVIEQHIRNPLLVDMLICPVMFYGNPGGVGDGNDAARTKPDMDWLLFCVVWKCIFESGFGFPLHGMRPLWQLLAERIEADGGFIRLGARVDKLVEKDGAIVAARLADGEEVSGKMFFSSAGSCETQRLVGGGKTGCPIGSISIAEGISVLDEPPAVAGMDSTVIFYSFSDHFHFARPRGLIEDGSGVVCAPGNYRCAGTGAIAEIIVKITQLASYPAWQKLSKEAYRYAKQETAAGMAMALGKLGITPDKARNLERDGKFGIFDDLFTPLTLERFTLHAEGALYGSPVKARDGSTDYENLVLIGADQGFHGIVGAMLSGVAMANLRWLAAHT